MRACVAALLLVYTTLTAGAQPMGDAGPAADRPISQADIPTPIGQLGDGR